MYDMKPNTYHYMHQIEQVSFRRNMNEIMLKIREIQYTLKGS